MGTKILWFNIFSIKWCEKYEKGKILDAHYHNTFDRSSTQTQEIVYVISGEIICNIYTKEGVFINTFNLSSGMFAVQLYGVHEYEIVENAKVLEVKNGPYFGPEKDRTRINVKKN